MNNTKKTRIIWNDARVYSPQDKTVALSPMETTGNIEKETETYIVVRNPITVRLSDKKEHPQTRPTFYMIPKSMIQSIESE